VGFDIRQFQRQTDVFTRDAIGFVIMAAAGYLVYSAIIIFVFVKWFVHIIDGIIENQQQSLNEMLSLLRDLHAAFEALKNKL